MKYKIFKVPKGIEDHLFRITQEAISNTLRHSNGTKVTVELFNKDDYLLLRIQDNGKGFNVDEKLEQSYGLKNMRERALKLVQRSILYHCQIQVHVSR